MSDIQPGAEFRVRYPYVRQPVTLCGEDGPYDANTWRPGVSIENDGSSYDQSVWAESEGEMVLTVIDTFKPGRFPRRVFYTRQWIDPDGNAFGKSKLQICTLEKFGRISKGYQLAYDLEETFEEAAERRAGRLAA